MCDIISQLQRVPMCKLYQNNNREIKLTKIYITKNQKIK